MHVLRSSCWKSESVKENAVRLHTQLVIYLDPVCGSLHVPDLYGVGRGSRAYAACLSRWSPRRGKRAETSFCKSSVLELLDCRCLSPSILEYTSEMPVSRIHTGYVGESMRDPTEAFLPMSKFCTRLLALCSTQIALWQFRMTRKTSSSRRRMQQKKTQKGNPRRGSNPRPPDS